MLALKKQYKEATGKDWAPPKPGSGSSPTKAAKEGSESKKGGAMAAEAGKVAVDATEAVSLKAEVDAQGDKVRQLKTGGGAKVSFNVIFFFCHYVNLHILF